MLGKPTHKRRSEGGFTLIEVTIAMMVFAITITAITAMQNTAINAASTSLTMQEAGTLADQFMETLSVDALRWQNSSNPSIKYLGGNSAYKMTQASTAMQWNRYTNAPVNYLMRYKSHGATGRGARYCIFFAYAWVGTSANRKMTGELVELNVAVLSPRNPSGLSNSVAGCNNARTRFDTCDPGLLAENNCSTTARRSQFIRLSRATMIRRNRSGF